LRADWTTGLGEAVQARQQGVGGRRQGGIREQRLDGALGVHGRAAGGAVSDMGQGPVAFRMTELPVNEC
jgi:hypothetical protein